MPPLENHRQEKFCVELFKQVSQGKYSPRQAMIAAGYSGMHASNTYVKWLEIPYIQERIKELKEAVAKEAVADVQERQEILSEIARGKMSDYVDEKGEIINNLKNAPNQAAIGSYSVYRSSGGEGGRFSSESRKIGVRNPIEAISELNKMDHIYEIPPQINDNRQVNIIVQDPETKELMGQVAERTQRLISAKSESDKGLQGDNKSVGKR